MVIVKHDQKKSHGTLVGTVHIHLNYMADTLLEVRQMLNKIQEHMSAILSHQKADQITTTRSSQQLAF